MFPIRDHNPATRTPLVNYALIALNVVVFIAYVPLFADQFALLRFFEAYAIIPAKITVGQDWYALVTSMFLHGGWLHLLGNMLFLFIFGDNLEDQLGHLGYLGFYLACGLGAGILQVLTEPGSTIPVVGASGAIAGVMGGYLLMFPRARIDIFIFLIVIIRILPVPAWLMLGLWFGMQVINGAAATAGTGGVAYWAHAGGFVLGLALMLPVWLAKGGPRFWQQTHGSPAHPEARYRHVRTMVPRVSQKPGRRATTPPPGAPGGPQPSRLPRTGRRR